MRIRAVAILVCIVQAAFLDNAPTTQAERPKLSVGLPRIDVIYPPYGTVFDRTCSEFLREADLKPEWINEAGKLRSALQKEWDNEGPKYLSIIFEEIGLPFPYLEMQAVLTVCSINTMSMPLLINVRSLLPAAPHRPPPGDFTEKVFHELMHHYVEPVHSSSALRKKYAATPPQSPSPPHRIAARAFPRWPQ